ncbi:hypothetical protein [Bradyrhizobium algeriense]|uniref:hypothetical protein n=1 Tax=Bradyrhizobium algeriense TaxID=634784 RepID=UPI002FF377B4
MTFKAVFLNFWPSANPDMGVRGADRAVSGCNILILPVDASRFTTVPVPAGGCKRPGFAGFTAGLIAPFEGLRVVVGALWRGEGLFRQGLEFSVGTIRAR